MEGLPKRGGATGLPPVRRNVPSNRGSLPSRGVFGEITNLPGRGGSGTPVGGSLSHRGHLNQSMGQSGFQYGQGMNDSGFGNTGFSFAGGDKENMINAKSNVKARTANMINVNLQAGDRLAQDQTQKEENEIAGFFANKKLNEIGTYMEILKSGHFKPYTGRRQEFKESRRENLELVLLNNIHSFERLLIKFFLWMQGLVAGISLLHLYLVTSSDNNQHLLETNSNIAKTISQVLNVSSMLSLVGMMVMALREHEKFNADPSTPNRRRRLISYLALVTFFLVYMSTLVNIPFVNNWNWNNERYPNWYSNQQSDEYNRIFTSDFSDDLDMWKFASIFRGVSAVLGWFILMFLIEWDKFDDYRVHQYFGKDPELV